VKRTITQNKNFIQRFYFFVLVSPASRAVPIITENIMLRYILLLFFSSSSGQLN